MNGELFLTLGPGEGIEFRLRHWDGDRFAFTPPGENATGASSLTFTVNPLSDQAASFNAEYYDDDGLGTFART